MFRKIHVMKRLKSNQEDIYRIAGSAGDGGREGGEGREKEQEAAGESRLIKMSPKQGKKRAKKNFRPLRGRITLTGPPNLPT